MAAGGIWPNGEIDQRGPVFPRRFSNETVIMPHTHPNQIKPTHTHTHTVSSPDHRDTAASDGGSFAANTDKRVRSLFPFPTVVLQDSTKHFRLHAARIEKPLLLRISAW